MPRIREDLKKEIKKAEKRARKEALKPKKRRRYSTRVTKPQHPTSKWVDDEWGEQGCIFFDGYCHWVIELRNSRDCLRVVNRGLTVEEWNNYTKGNYKIRENGSYEFGGKYLERTRSAGPARGEQTPTEQTYKQRKPTRNKIGKCKSLPGRKSSKLVKGKRKSRKIVKN